MRRMFELRGRKIGLPIPRKRIIERMRDKQINAQESHEIGIEPPLTHGIAVTAGAKGLADYAFLAIQPGYGSRRLHGHDPMRILFGADAGR